MVIDGEAVFLQVLAKVFPLHIKICARGDDSERCLDHSVTLLIILIVICSCYIWYFVCLLLGRIGITVNRLVNERFGFEFDLVYDVDWRNAVQWLASIAVTLITSALVTHFLHPT